MKRTLLLTFAAVMVASTASAQIAINEILGDPARDWDGNGALDAKGDEWVEIINLGTETVDLQDYWLRDDSSRLPDVGLNGLLGPGEVKVVYGSDVVAFQHSQGWLETGFGINNSGGDYIFLLYGPYDPELNYTILEQRWVGSHEATDDRSSGRDPDTGMWELFDGLNPYGGSATPQGNGCNPTPGGLNLCEQPVATETLNLGTLKMLFR